MSALDLLVLGDINPDVVVSGAPEPIFGQAETLVDDARSVVGGSAAITACAAAKLGLRTAIVGVVGDDPAGRTMLSELSDAGVGVEGCPVDASVPTGMSVILSRGEDRAILTARGAVPTLRAEAVDPALLSSARHVHVSSYFLQSGLAPDLPALFEQIRGSGASTSVDPNWDPSGRWNGGLEAVIEHSTCVFLNAAEAMGITGAGDVETAAEDLASGGGLVVVKLGGVGALARLGDDVWRQAAPPSQVKDTIGAGDTFDAGFLAGWLEGWLPQRCLALAVACGSLSTRGLGGTAAQPTMEEALAAMEGEG